MKRCSKCSKTGRFYKNKLNKDGLQSQCVSCHFLYTKKAAQKFYKKNPGYNAQLSKKRREKNPGEQRYFQTKREAAKAQRTPKWLTKSQKSEIKEFYILAKELQWLSEDKLTIDHIVPIQSEIVSGLHVPWNLQILPAKLNAKKGNRDYKVRSTTPLIDEQKARS